MLLQAVNFTGYRLIRREATTGNASAVRRLTAGGLNMNFTIFFKVIVSDLSKRSLIFKTKT